MKLLLLADGAVGLAITQWLIEQFPDDISLLATLGDNAIAQAGRGAGIAWVEAARVAPAIDLPVGEQARFDLGITAWWPYIIPRDVVQLPRGGFVNTHPSYLPHNRGKHYNFWAIVEQCPFGVSLHRIGQSIDGGDIVAQRAIRYGWEDTGGSLYARAQTAMVELFKETYPLLREGDAPAAPQDPQAGSFHLASEIEKASRIELDDLTSGRQLLNLIRARTFPGKPASWFSDQGIEYEVRIDIKRKAR